MLFILTQADMAFMLVISPVGRAVLLFFYCMNNNTLYYYYYAYDGETNGYNKLLLIPVGVNGVIPSLLSVLHTRDVISSCSIASVIILAPYYLGELGQIFKGILCYEIWREGL